MEEQAHHSQGVLIAEDEPLIRMLLRKLLSQWGYRTMVACDGEEAMSLAERHDEGINVLVSDVAMPGMSGQELAEKMSERFPALKVVLISGYSQVQLSLRRGWAFVPKPFKPEAIRHAIEKLSS